MIKILYSKTIICIKLDVNLIQISIMKYYSRMIFLVKRVIKYLI